MERWKLICQMQTNPITARERAEDSNQNIFVKFFLKVTHEANYKLTTIATERRWKLEVKHALEAKYHGNKWSLRKNTTITTDEERFSRTNRHFQHIKWRNICRFNKKIRRTIMNGRSRKSARRRLDNTISAAFIDIHKW